MRRNEPMGFRYEERVPMDYWEILRTISVDESGWCFTLDHSAGPGKKLGITGLPGKNFEILQKIASEKSYWTLGLTYQGFFIVLLFQSFKWQYSPTSQPVQSYHLCLSSEHSRAPFNTNTTICCFHTTQKYNKTQIVLYIPAKACIMDFIVVKQLNNFK